ncbi:hypothetical protein [Endozoicomonas sp. YOMI1]|uniref:hypothetical protein n=1 Tax=Endozoicomonas sp. YOMI1 TaxID=2828739 RepID=UPI00214988B7|nr:hypothetical protein [Endozoicomonas sp. YOMI1]
MSCFLLCEAKSQPGKSQLQRTDSEERIRNQKIIEENKIKEEKLKKDLVGNIERLRQENGLAFDKCTITKRAAKALFDFDPCWHESDGLPNYGEFQVASTTDNLEGFSLETLLAEEKSLKFMNQKLCEYIALLWDSFPSPSDQRQRPLIRFKYNYSVERVKTEADEILAQPAQQSCISGGSVKSQMFSSRYAREQKRRESLLDELRARALCLTPFDSAQDERRSSSKPVKLIKDCS